METTEARVAANVATLRQRSGLTVRELSALLTELGHPILPSGITKIENRTRRVNIDDLLALALALGCSPNRLLLAPDASDENVIELAPEVSAPTRAAWEWARGEAPLSDSNGRILFEFQAANRPDKPPMVIPGGVGEHYEELREIGAAMRALHDRSGWSADEITTFASLAQIGTFASVPREEV